MAKRLWNAYSPMLQVADKTEPPTLMMPVGDHFLPSIGRLIVCWALLEKEVSVLLWALLEKNGTPQQSWKKHGFQGRFDLLQKEWLKFCAGSQLSALIAPTFAKIRKAKILRDHIAHGEANFGGLDNGEAFIQFYNANRAKQLSKPYRQADFEEASADAQFAAGELHWITDKGSAWPLPQADAERLRTLPDTAGFRKPL